MSTHWRNAAAWPAWRAIPLVAGAALLTLSGCSSLLGPSVTPTAVFYSLDGPPGPVANLLAVVGPAAATLPALVVAAPRAAAGFDSQRIMYVREQHKLEYFAHSEWVEPPARLITPLLVGTLQATGAFRAVVLAAGAAAGELRLDTEIIRLQQDFRVRPSRVVFVLRATLVEDRTRRVVGQREFESQVAAASDDPYGGVVAANRAVQAVLNDLARFCTEAARAMPLPVPVPTGVAPRAGPPTP